MLRSAILEELVSRPKFKWETAQTIEECEQTIRENVAALSAWQAEHAPIMVMCPPTYFDIVNAQTVAGNGFLEAGSIAYGKNKQKNLEIMSQDWCSFQTQLRDRGVELMNMSPHKGLPDEVFTADASQSYVFIIRLNNKLIENHSVTLFSNFSHPGRIAEVKEAEDFFAGIQQQNTFAGLFEKRIILHATHKLEGTGDNLIDPYRGILISGYGKRNCALALLELQDKTGIPVYGIKSKEPFFHVDTYICILPGGYVLYAPEVMHEEGVQQLEQALFKGHAALKEKYAIIVSKKDAEDFVCNAVIVGEEVIMQPCSDVLKDALATKGIHVTFAPAAIANLAGGGFHCMTNKINQPIYYNLDLTLAQQIRDKLHEGKTEEQIVIDYSSTHAATEVKSICREVKQLDEAESNIQNSLRFWQTPITEQVANITNEPTPIMQPAKAP